MQLSERAFPAGKGATSIRLVMIDIAYHPGTSISEVVQRTGFPQSHVSASVARLREIGVVETEADPLDRRRTLVRTRPSAVAARADNTPVASVEELLTKELGDASAEDVATARAELEHLARLLIPEVIDRPGSES
jgi:DNA-binding MarR family transcriptional regulator